MKRSPIAALAMLGLLPGLTGCPLTHHTRAVLVTHPPAVVKTADLREIISQLRTRYEAVQSITARVEITATMPSKEEGKENVSVAFPGHILLRKPGDVRVLLTVPFLGTQAMDMVSTEGRFTMYIRQPTARAVVGSDAPPTRRSANPLENLRPFEFFNSMLIRPIRPDALAGRTLDSRIYQPDPKSSALIEEPEYDLHSYIEKPGDGQQLEPLRVIHIGRSTLLPYQQDIYDPASGNLTTEATYDGYRNYDGILFPSVITIRLPADKLSVKITILDMTPNEKLGDDEFHVTVPANTPTQTLP